MVLGCIASAQSRGVRQFLKFGIVGALGFVVNLIVFTLLQRAVPNHDQAVPYYLIFSFAFLAGGVSNYCFNRIWTFRSTGDAVKEGAQFLSVSMIALAVGPRRFRADRAVSGPRPQDVVPRDRRRHFRQLLPQQILDVQAPELSVAGLRFSIGSRSGSR